MSEPVIFIRFDGNGGIYQPGEVLSGEYRIESVERDQIEVIEVSVLWHTEGKGDEDLAVHEFWRRAVDADQWIDPRRPERFSTTLPSSPLSYDGQIVKIEWCVRVRAFLARGQLLGERVFWLGNIRPAAGPEPADAADALHDADSPEST